MTSSDSSPTDENGDADDPRSLREGTPDDFELPPQSEDAPDEILPMVDGQVVLDTRGSLVYIGTLKRISSNYFVLTDADVCDVPRARTTKEIYIMESAKYGVKKNRQLVFVVRHEVLSISRLKDVVVY